MSASVVYDVRPRARGSAKAYAPSGELPLRAGRPGAVERDTASRARAVGRGVEAPASPRFTPPRVDRASTRTVEARRRIAQDEEDCVRVAAPAGSRRTGSCSFSSCRPTSSVTGHWARTSPVGFRQRSDARPPAPTRRNRSGCTRRGRAAAVPAEPVDGDAVRRGRFLVETWNEACRRLDAGSTRSPRSRGCPRREEPTRHARARSRPDAVQAHGHTSGGTPATASAVKPMAAPQPPTSESPPQPSGMDRFSAGVQVERRRQARRVT
jgi:hypothetical protein